MKKIRISFLKHQGELELSTRVVEFYGLYFLNITEAIGFLNNIEPGEYEPYYLRGHKGVTDMNGNIFLNNKWWKDEQTILKMLSE